MISNNWYNNEQLKQQYFIGIRTQGLEDKKDKKDKFLFFDETLIMSNLCSLCSRVLGVRTKTMITTQRVSLVASPTH